jgi:glycosyltransferase involved in cell wall biosynthesis
MKEVSIRVLLVGPTSPPSAGIEAATESLLVGLARAPGVVWCHLNTRKPVPNAGRGRLGLTNLLWAARHIAGMLGQCLSFRPDVVHLPIAHNRLGFMRDACLALCAKVAGARLLLQAHNDSYDKFVLSQPRGLRELILGVYRWAAAIAVQGASLRGQFERLGLGGRVVVLTNHLDVADFREARTRPQAGGRTPLRVLLLGRVSIAKGAWDLARAAVEATRRLRSPVHLVLAGEVVSTDASVAHLANRSMDVPSLIERLLDEAAPSAVQVSYVGVLDRETKLRELARADVLALPSYSEALPYAILEGAAAALPILASDVGMIPELRSKGLRGEFVQPGDVEGLTSALVALADPTRRTTDGRSNLALAEREFDVGLLPDRLAALYRQITVRPAGVPVSAQ